MKKIFLLLVALFILDPEFAWAAPYLVCDPYPSTVTQPDGFVLKLDGGADIDSPAQTVTGGKRLHYDLVGISTGSHTVTVKAYKNDAQWGRLESPVSSPFTFARPANPSVPAGIGLSTD